jgi:hypothetical protein
VEVEAEATGDNKPVVVIRGIRDLKTCSTDTTTMQDYFQQFKQPFSNTTQYYKNWNYCWTCGFDAPDGHTNASCPHPKLGHVYHATREDPCNGCMNASHKTTM